VVCSTCGIENETGRKFCKECGERLAATCPSCGATNTPDAKYCGECATRLPGAVAPGAGAAGEREDRPAGGPSAVAERRLVSVLFADLVGFTALAEGRDAEDTRDLLSRYFDLARDVIQRYGGTVEKFIGDAVMAVWGAPVAHEDDAERAVRAGLELVDAVGTLGSGISARAGVLTGEAAVTLGAVGQGMVAGDLVNTAARLQSIAPSGAVLVGESTRHAAARAIAFEPAGEQVLKGKTAPLPAWRAVRVVAEVGGRGRSDGLEAPFVGRADELRLLKDLFHATTRERRTRLVSVFGPAGIGKTRLAWEFLKYVDGLVDRVWWHDGRSPAYGDGISFWALGEMVRQGCGLVETDDEATTRARVAETLAAHIPDPAERRWVEPAVLALLGVESGAGSEQLFAAWRTFFERLAASAPVVLVFEDFHFADAGLVDFVDHLLEWSRTVPIYVVTLARPEMLEKRPDWGAAKRNFASLFLDPLPPEEMRELLAGLVPGLPEAAIGAIVARADGMPLYAVETVRMLLAQGRLSVDGGAYRPVGDLANLAVPDTLTALIGSRLDMLAPADRALVSDAAVLGQSFTLAGLSAVSATPGSDLEPRVRGLVRRELLRLEVDPRSPERGQYSFVQALIREVAYNTLAKRDRKTRHLAAAGFFERLGSDELAGALAGHFLAAHANSAPGPEADTLAAQACVTLRAAADRASALGSHAQAIGFLEQAISVTSEPGARAELLEQAGSAAGAASEIDRARVLLEDAIALHRERGDRASTCRATTELVRIMLMRSTRSDALAMVEAADAEFGDLAETPVGVALRAQLARAQFLLERHAESIVTADAVLPVAERLDLVPIIADLLVTKGSALGSAGRPREGVGVTETGRRLAESVNLPFTVLRATLNSIAPIQEDDPAACLEIARRGLDLSTRLGLTGFALVFRESVAFFNYRTGDWDAAVASLDAGLETIAERDRVHLEGWRSSFAVLRGEPPGPHLDEVRALLAEETDPQTLSHLAELQTIAGLASGTVDDVKGAVTWVQANFPAGIDSFHWATLARVALWSGDVETAAGALERHRAYAIRGRALAATGMGLAAGIAALEGRPDEARASYRTAMRGLADLGLRWERALASLDMAVLLDPADPDVRAAAASARETFDELGARPFAERLEEALQRVGGRPAPARS